MPQRIKTTFTNYVARHLIYENVILITTARQQYTDWIAFCFWCWVWQLLQISDEQILLGSQHNNSQPFYQNYGNVQYHFFTIHIATILSFTLMGAKSNMILPQSRTVTVHLLFLPKDISFAYYFWQRIRNMFLVGLCCRTGDRKQLMHWEREKPNTKQQLMNCDSP